MSQPADAPDGSDPRILAPSADEPDVIIKASGGGSSRAYHTARCRNVKKMNSTRTVKQSVAEWKGFDECEICIHEGDHDPTADDDETEATRRMMSPETCAELRRRYLSGEPPAEIEADCGWSRTAMNQHVRGRCAHNDDVDAPECDYGWHASKDGETGDRASRTRVSPQLCEAMRRQLLAGKSRGEVADFYDISFSCVGTHVKGECNHAPDAHSAPPLDYGWHRAEAEE